MAKNRTLLLFNFDRDKDGFSGHEQFGALAAALLAACMGWPGTRPEAVLACQHKLHARQILDTVAPEANLAPGLIDASHAELTAHTRFGWGERWIIEHLVEPFERIARQRLPAAGSAHKAKS